MLVASAAMTMTRRSPIQAPSGGRRPRTILCVLMHPADMHDQCAAEAVLTDPRGRDPEMEYIFCGYGQSGSGCLAGDGTRMDSIDREASTLPGAGAG